MLNNPKKYYVYIVECADGSYYTGYTTDIQRRINEHNYSMKSAKYTRSRRPVKLIHEEEYDTLSAALKREHAIKKLKKKQKKSLVESKKTN